jgi:hypothetical protein
MANLFNLLSFLVPTINILEYFNNTMGKISFTNYISYLVSWFQYIIFKTSLIKGQVYINKNIFCIKFVNKVYSLSKVTLQYYERKVVVFLFIFIQLGIFL